MKFYRKLYAFFLVSLAVPAECNTLEGRPISGESIGIAVVGAIVNSTVPDKSVALIKETKSGKVTPVKAGFTINSYKIIKIKEKFILVSSPTNEKLLVYQNRFAGEFQALSSNVPAQMSAPLSDSYREDGFERSQNRIVMTAAYRDKLIKQDLQKILMQATAEPHIVNGQIQGFKFSEIDDASIFKKSGLQNNDIVTSINDHKLTNVGAAIQLLNSLRGSEEVEFDIIRGNQPAKVKIEVR